MARAAKGDGRAREELFRRHVGLVTAVASGHLPGGAESVEDVVQETFLIAFREMGGLRRPESFGAWISTIARNLARAAAVERLRRLRAEGGEEIPPEPAARPPGPDRDELYRSVLAEIERLPGGLREVFLLRYVGGRSCARICEDLDLPLGTVTSRLSRGHRLLRERMRKAREVGERP